MATSKKYEGPDIAIIGMAGQFPQSGNYREFWKNLRSGRELLTTYPDEDLRASGVSEDALRDPRYVKTAGSIDNKELFDAGFFGYSAEEASLMDPQIRLFHQYCWEALEDAGYASSTDKYKIGLYAGAACSDNWKMYVHARAKNTSVDPFFLRMIIAERFISTLISYKLNLRGPSMYVDTACSTSLVAVHLACRSLLTRECSIALAGGISVKTLKRKGYLYEEGMVSSSDGRCRAFDAQASGTASGEGAGIVVLKRLSEAVNDRDHIYAVIRSTAANNDGNLKVGYTAPSVKGQADCIRMAQKLAGVDPQSISYIEAHGTATILGDPIEIRALNESFAVGGKEKFCAIGSVKSNVGHLDAAAGVTGLIKAVLSLKNRQIPASLHFHEPNPEIDFDGGPFFVNTQLREWQRRGEEPLRAGVSSLGIGGTNAHVVLEEAPSEEKGDPGRIYKLLTVSGKTSGAVERYLDNLHDFLQEEPWIDLADASYALHTGRRHFAYRKAIAFKSREELLEELRPGKEKEPAVRSKDNCRTVFMFSAAGSQYVNMGKDLYDNEPVFREEMNKGFKLLQSLTGQDYHSIFYPASAEDHRINHMQHAQPAIFLFEYSLARLIMSYGITPEYMIGHSIGEYAAACISGVFSYEDALRLVVKRGMLMNTLKPGAMLSAQIQEERAKDFLQQDISLAAVNGHDQVVFSGSVEAIDALAAMLDHKGLSCVKLHATHAGHSYMMDDILELYRAELEVTSKNAPQIPFIAGVTGKFISLEECRSTDYWVRHMRETVRFSDGIATIAGKKKELIYLETGAGNSLTSLLKQRNTDSNAFIAINPVRHPKEPGNDLLYFSRRMAQLWALGINPDWDVYYKNEKRNKVSLPTYSFEPAKYPAEVDPFENGFSDGAHLSAGVAKQELKDWIYYPSWKRAVLYAPQKDGAGKTYLLFVSDKALGGRLKKGLEESAHEAVEVFAGEKYEKLPSGQFTIDPTRPNHYIKLFSDLRSSGKDITDIIYEWGTGVAPSAIALWEENKEVNLVYFSLVNIVKALSQHAGTRGTRMVVLTRSLYTVLGTEKGMYSQALMLGLVKTIPQELSLPCCNVDIEDSANAVADMRLLLDEIGNSAGPDRIVALRNGQRWIQDLQRHIHPVDIERTAIREGGTYLITGGLGNVGFTLAKYLITKYNARLVLTGRSQLLEDDEQADAGNVEKRARLRFLHSISPELMYYSTDVADPEAFQRTVEDSERIGGAFHGVIHAAGITDDHYFEFIETTDPKITCSMFAPKVKGIESLYSIFRGRTPDFVWITSSLSSVLGGLGYCSYASANAYMNHFVYSKRDELPSWKCVILGELAFSKKSIEEEKDTNRKAMKAQELIGLFEWSLSANHSPVILQSTGDLFARIDRSEHEKKEADPDNAEEQVDISRRERPVLSTVYAEADTETEKKLKAMFENFMGIDRIGVDDHFFELGGDSLKGMMLLKRINGEFNINLALKDFLLNPAIRAMAARIDEGVWLQPGVEMENEITI